MGRERERVSIVGRARPAGLGFIWEEGEGVHLGQTGPKVDKQKRGKKKASHFKLNKALLTNMFCSVKKMVCVWGSQTRMGSRDSVVLCVL